MFQLTVGLGGEPHRLTALDHDFVQWAIRYQVRTERVTQTVLGAAERVARISDSASAGSGPHYPIIVKIDFTKVPVMVNAISAQEYRDAPNEYDWEESFKVNIKQTTGKGALVYALIPICWKPKALFLELPLEVLEDLENLGMDTDASTPRLQIMPTPIIDITSFLASTSTSILILVVVLSNLYP